MKRTQGNGINLYEGYLALAKKEQSGKSGKRTTLILPLVLLLLIMLGIAGKLLLDNRQRVQELDALQQEMDALAAGEKNVQQLQARRDDAVEAYSDLTNARFTFGLYPVITQEILVTIRECADEIFVISRYAYDETTGVVSVNASAVSVNEVAEFVQRLRDTGLFSRVQYIGYTSEDTLEYFCEVACTIIDEDAIAIAALLEEEAFESDEGEAEDEALTEAEDVADSVNVSQPDPADVLD